MISICPGGHTATVPTGHLVGGGCCNAPGTACFPARSTCRFSKARRAACQGLRQCTLPRSGDPLTPTLLEAQGTKLAERAAASAQAFRLGTPPEPPRRGSSTWLCGRLGRAPGRGGACHKSTRGRDDRRDRWPHGAERPRLLRARVLSPEGRRVPAVARLRRSCRQRHQDVRTCPPATAPVAKRRHVPERSDVSERLAAYHYWQRDAPAAP